METALAAAIAQFGVAGLIGWLWLAERRAAAEREKQLRELHERLMQERRETGVLLSVVGDNTRALAALEAGQRGIGAALERLAAFPSCCAGCPVCRPASGRGAHRTG
jgi:hypothetical protein